MVGRGKPRKGRNVRQGALPAVGVPQAAQRAVSAGYRQAAKPGEPGKRRYPLRASLPPSGAPSGTPSRRACNSVAALPGTSVCSGMGKSSFWWRINAVCGVFCSSAMISLFARQKRLSGRLCAACGYLWKLFALLIAPVGRGQRGSAPQVYRGALVFCRFCDWLEWRERSTRRENTSITRTKKTRPTNDGIPIPTSVKN